MRHAIWTAMTLAALCLAGCRETEEEPMAEPSVAATPAPDATAASRAPSWNDPDAPAGIAVSAARLTLPAVFGNPGAVYFTIRNSGDVDQAIRSVWVAGAEMATLHETQTTGGTARMRDLGEVPVPAGETVTFAPGGLHVMAMNVGGALEEGGETEVTLTFASGDKVSFPAEIRGAGAGAGVGE